ncbi:hypothetical protein D3C72_1422980 [compost metagenome]
MTLGVLAAAHRRHLFGHQQLTDQPRKVPVAIQQCQVDMPGAKIHRLVAGTDVQTDLRIALLEVRQPRYQPTLGNGRPGIERQGAADGRGGIRLQGFFQVLHQPLHQSVQALTFVRQANASGQAFKQAQRQHLFEPGNTVTDCAGGQVQLLRRQGKTQVPRGHGEGVQVGKLRPGQTVAKAWWQVEHAHCPASTIRPLARYASISARGTMLPPVPQTR